MLIDTHTHVHFNAFKDESDDVVKRALAEDVWMVTVGTQKDTSKYAVELAEKFSEGVYSAVGLHPVHVTGETEEAQSEGSELAFKTRREDFDPEYYRALIKSSKKVVAIGECGLDYYRVPAERLAEAKIRQREQLLMQIKLADETNLPLLFHCRDAHADLQTLISEEITVGRLKRRGIIHCFTSTYEDAMKYIEMGFVISFSGIVTFSKSLADVAKLLPLNKIVIETDAPYLTPVPYRGKRNEPRYVRYTAEHLAKVRGISFEELVEATTANAKRVFGI